VNVALPSIERDLGASAARAQWVVSGYALAFALALVPAGRLGDALGRRQMFLSCGGIPGQEGMCLLEPFLGCWLDTAN
jgi:MFS family permease